ncbi:monocarboxylate transporter [Fusarium denticulatum]|uniref:Monocarboxylate transporter n=1 Tax=Fusarium denticulatum TaxID=48507 RepID=A0A8H5UFI7_9HYPO|nr:monocarboxylate transporter [Fusarium denticulatum]
MTQAPTSHDSWNDADLNFEDADLAFGDGGLTNDIGLILNDIDLGLNIHLSDAETQPTPVEHGSPRGSDDPQTFYRNNGQLPEPLPYGLGSGKELLRDQPDSVASDTQTPPKIKTRFSSDSVRVLNNWLMNHTSHPYPTVADIERLQILSKLSKQQILNWFSNARRRKKFQLSKPPGFDGRSSETHPVDICRQRPPTPIVADMSPLQRWQNSPPENEPANVAAITRAVSNLRPDLGDLTGICSTDNQPSHSQDNACSITSTGASDSSQDSHNSIYSQSSQGSNKSISLIRKIRKRRKRADNRAGSGGPRTLLQASQPFQCTFCTETFKTKHNWQRHEKSLHLSLEQWQCSPDGPTIIDGNAELVCVYCGLVGPNQRHLDSHNYTSCQERQKEERTFYRKDHLIQHLRLVHDAQFRKWPMERWKFDKSEEIRSQCGICKLHISTWSERADHLADHFKDGKTMADWKGGWGFEAPVLDMIENSMPPYLIHYERNSPLPFTTQQGAPYSPTSAFELIQLELDYFVTCLVEAKHGMPSNKTLQYEACCIIFGAETLYHQSTVPKPSWLRDLLMSSEEVTKEARIRPMRDAAKSRLTQLKIYGKEDIFEDCKLEGPLRQHVDIQQLLNFEVGYEELQREAKNIVNQMPNSSPIFINLLFDLIYSSTHWLVPFCIRANLDPANTMWHVDGSGAPVAWHGLVSSHTERPAEQDTMVLDENTDSTALETPKIFLSTDGSCPNVDMGARAISLNDTNLYRELTRELSRFVTRAMSPLNPNNHVPTDEELRYQARWIEYDNYGTAKAATVAGNMVHSFLNIHIGIMVSIGGGVPTTRKEVRLGDVVVSHPGHPLVQRLPRPSAESNVHHGKVASRNQVIKHGKTRDRISNELSMICFEMEAAGLLAANLPCLVIRGISDYAYSHKNDHWREYAAATAAAYTKKLLVTIPTMIPKDLSLCCSSLKIPPRIDTYSPHRPSAFCQVPTERPLQQPVLGPGIPPKMRQRDTTLSKLLLDRLNLFKGDQ